MQCASYTVCSTKQANSAVCGTQLGYSSTRVLRSAVPSWSIVLCPSGTKLGYGATRRQRSRR
eukprot:1410337-Rhodomonas_salina.1